MLRKFLATACFALCMASPALAASCVVSEHDSAVKDGVQIAKMPAIRVQNVIVSGSTQAATAVGGDTNRLIRVWCDAQSAFEVGANPTASATVSVPLAAGGSEYFALGEPLKIAFIARP